MEESYANAEGEYILKLIFYQVPFLLDNFERDTARMPLTLKESGFLGPSHSGGGGVGGGGAVSAPLRSGKPIEETSGVGY